jgi:integrase
LKKSSPQAALFWSLGCDTGLRVSDILRLRVGDVLSGSLCVIEGKTKKKKTVGVGEYTLKLARHYVAANGLKNDHYIFHDEVRGGEVMQSRQYIWRAIKKAGQAIGLPRL